jgi:hypothetical protein
MAASSGRVLADSSGRVLYRSPWILPARMLLRMKVLQVGSLVGMGFPAVMAARGGDLGLADYAILGSTFAGSLVVGGSLAFISERFVGEIRLRDDARSVLVSTLSVWGNRIDHSYPTASIVPLSARSLAHTRAVPLSFAGARGRGASEKQHVVILREDHAVDRAGLEALLTGKTGRE